MTFPSPPQELSLTAGTRVYGFQKEEEWWFGVSQNGNKGYFPSTFVREEAPAKITEPLET